MISVTGEVKSISLDVIKDIEEVGNTFTFKILSNAKKEKTGLKDSFNEFYGQKSIQELVYDCEYNIHGLLSYNSNNDTRDGDGLVEECDIGVTVTTYELSKTGYLDDVESVGDIPNKLKRHTIITLGDIDYSIVDVNFQAVYMGFPILIVLNCDKLSKKDGKDGD